MLNAESAENSGFRVGLDYSLLSSRKRTFVFGSLTAIFLCKLPAFENNCMRYLIKIKNASISASSLSPEWEKKRKSAIPIIKSSSMPRSSKIP